MTDVTPFRGRRSIATTPTRVLHRFVKPGGHTAEIRERTVTMFRGIEFVVFVDRSMLESQMFHGLRLREYPKALQDRVQAFLDDGWVERPVQTSTS